eukprot:13928500-Ditylum_brightwellii.AAC.1
MFKYIFYVTTTVAMSKYLLLTIFITGQLTPTVLIPTCFSTYIDLLDFQTNASEDYDYNNDMDSTYEINFVDTMQLHDNDKADLEFTADVEEYLFSNDEGYL